MTLTRRDLWLFWLFALLILATGLGLRDPWPADEPRFALVAKHMVESGHWLFPQRGIELYSDKPPLFMWMQASLLWLTGNLRIAFLLPSLLAALGTLWCVVDLGKRLWTPRVGIYAGWAVLLTIQFTFQAKKAQIDPMVVFWITLSCYGLLRHVWKGPDWRMWALGWAAAGLGTITKGVGVIALLMLIPAGMASLRGWPDVRVHARNPRFWLGPLAFLAACGVWLIPMLIAALGNGGDAYRAYVDDILLRQTVTRYANSWHHGQPWWYFIEVALTTWLPTLLVLPWAIPAWKHRLERRDARYAVLLGWVVLVFVFFSIPSGKRDMYILPALPMLALALAPLLPGLLRKPNAQRLLLGFVLVFSLVALAAGIAMLTGDPKFARSFMEGRDAQVAQGLAWMFVASGGFGLGACLWFGRQRAHYALIAMLTALWVLYSLIGAPLLNDGSSSRGLMRNVGQAIGPDAQLGLVGWREQQMLMADRPTTDFGFKRESAQQFADGMRWQLQQPATRWLLVEEGDGLPACVGKSLARDMGMANGRRWWLLDAGATNPCLRRSLPH
ncbi:MAG TPA: glycosyltransferase family 39 protein [Thermomonas sp.]|jgi:4-amino-4-deoxy-L-arabinose transferase-like glycosyltransferase|uniref:ArnT family glycosyltransferase n=2 Tax=Thermomonas sp. TaxID=1971895 RepID=UPI002BD90AB4|nr:glycosyltransferase family 39 protein [Thermomonas sp.]MBS0458704.1 glycosyltransferase family 39 protein [Pseudomonadota bacterium]HOC10892.1 glycosyltransferase family 39 protein [Thermomonas sp.]HQQ57604.1 glycosyltransferase family 39 protein [Thermomonas sp.]